MSVGSPHVRLGMVWPGRVVSLLLGVVAVEGGFGWRGQLWLVAAAVPNDRGWWNYVVVFAWG